MLCLQETGARGRFLRMIIGQPEARAIQSAFYGMSSPRPSTWDLFVSTIELLGAELAQVVITAVEEERNFFATLELTVDGESRVVPCRPSDAVALALRVGGAKIMTFETVMGAAGVRSDGSRPAPFPVVGPADDAAADSAGDAAADSAGDTAADLAGDSAADSAGDTAADGAGNATGDSAADGAAAGQ